MTREEKEVPRESPTVRIFHYIAVTYLHDYFTTPAPMYYSRPYGKKYICGRTLFALSGTGFVLYII